MKNKPIILIAGEPDTIFFEIFFKTLKKKKYKSPLILICSKRILINQMKFFNFKKKLRILKTQDIKKKKIDNKNLNIIDLDLENSYAKNHLKISFDLAFKLIRHGFTNKLLNGPINKKFLNKKFLGITEYISNKFLIKKTGMLIFNKNLSVCPVTTHLPLKLVTRKINKKTISDKVFLIDNFYNKNFNIKPKIAILGLNPHCESIHKYNEDDKIIKPCIKSLSKKYNVSGPYSADTIFLKNNRKKFDVILGMYHDQVLTPLKTLFEYDAINITLGLPFIRISPDHGPNETMMGKKLSNPLSLIQAIRFLDKN